MSPPSAAEVPYGTLDLMVLKTLDALGPLHGYGIARRIEQVAEGRARAQSGHDLSGAAAPRAEGLHRQRVGHEREQPPRPLLHASPRPAGSSSRSRRQQWSRTRDDGQPAFGARILTRAARTARPALRGRSAADVARTSCARSWRRTSSCSPTSTADAACRTPQARLAAPARARRHRADEGRRSATRACLPGIDALRAGRSLRLARADRATAATTLAAIALLTRRRQQHGGPGRCRSIACCSARRPTSTIQRGSDGSTRRPLGGTGRASLLTSQRRRRARRRHPRRDRCIGHLPARAIGSGRGLNAQPLRGDRFQRGLLRRPRHQAGTRRVPHRPTRPRIPPRCGNQPCPLAAAVRQCRRRHRPAASARTAHAHDRGRRPTRLRRDRRRSRGCLGAARGPASASRTGGQANHYFGLRALVRLKPGVDRARVEAHAEPGVQRRRIASTDRPESTRMPAWCSGRCRPASPHRVRRTRRCCWPSPQWPAWSC